MSEQLFVAGSERSTVALLRHLQWQAEGFSIVFVFADVGPSRSLCRWLNERLTLDRRELQVHRPEQSFYAVPADAVESIVASALGSLPERGAVWFELQRHPADDAVNDARRRILARLNERRFVPERGMPVPLVIVLPLGFRTQAAQLAPDLWHVRAISITLDAQARIDRVPEILPAARDAEREPSRDSLSANSGGTDAALADWRRAMARRGGSDHSHLPTAFAAVSGLLTARRLDEARSVAEEALRVARERVTEGEPGRGTAQRDLNRSLTLLGDVARAQGDLAAAERAFGESLELARRLIERTGETPEALRDLVVSLIRLGPIIEDRSLLSEALDVSERLAGAFPDQSDFTALRDHVGDLQPADSS